MNRSLAIVIVGMTLLSAQAAQAAIKCWTNNEGYRECGNAVPPEYAQQEYRTLNKRGVTTEVKERAKTREELEQERQVMSEKKRLEEEQLRKEAEQASKDRVLLSTFLKPEEIIAARDRKIAVLDGYLEITHAAIENLKKKLEEEQGKVAVLERQGKRIPDVAVEEINSLHNHIADKESFIRQKEEEKRQLNIKYDADYQRFIELMNRKR